MDIGAGIYRVLNYIFPQSFPLDPPKTTEQIEEEANQACFRDIYSEPCARLSDLSEQKGGMNIQKEMMDLDARIRPMLNRLLADPVLDGGYCSQILVNSCNEEQASPSSSLSYTPVGDLAPERGCYEVLQCLDTPGDPSTGSLQIFLMLSPAGETSL